MKSAVYQKASELFLEACELADDDRQRLLEEKCEDPQLRALVQEMFAKDELLEEAALPALLIVVAGIPPIVIMNAALRRLAR